MSLPIFIEDLLYPLTISNNDNNDKLIDSIKNIKNSKSNINENINSKDIANHKLQLLLSALQIRPINSSEKSIVLNAVNKFIKSNNISQNSLLVKEFHKRLSFSFLPSVCELDLNNNKINNNNNINNNELNIKNEDNDVILEKNKFQRKKIHLNVTTTDKNNEIEKFITNTTTIESPNDNNSKEFGNKQLLSSEEDIYYMCTIRRSRSPLWTSYRMFIIEKRNVKTLKENKEEGLNKTKFAFKYNINQSNNKDNNNIDSERNNQCLNLVIGNENNNKDNNNNEDNNNIKDNNNNHQINSARMGIYFFLIINIFFLL
jgi:hypothetical protein